jgi:hypothetical protein
VEKPVQVEAQPDGAKKKMFNMNVGRSTIEMSEQFKSKDVIHNRKIDKPEVSPF